ncbi:hypothetical protein BDL97_02G038500 [Sphagnum fallax]|nr:hypothetical protein BDL97_02G038500 [Sphagnum fallax]
MGKRVMLCTSYGNGASPDGALSYSQLAKMPQHNVCDLSEEEEDDDDDKLFQLKKQQDVVIVPGIQKRRSRRSRRETMQQKRLAEVQQEKEMSRRIIRSPQVELMRELTAAVKKVRSLQDPSTLSSFDTLLEEDKSSSCVTGVSSRNNNNAAAPGAGMMMMMATTFGNELSQPLVAKKKKTRRSSKIRRGGGGVGVGDHHQLSNRQWRLGGAPTAGGSSDGARTLTAGCRITTQEIGGKDDNAAKGKEYRDGAPAAHGGDRGGAAEAGGSVQAQAIVDLNGRREGNDRRCYDDDGESPQQCAPRRVEKEAYRYGEGGQGDDEDDAENNARRLMMMSETRLLPCAPYPHHSFYVSELTSPAYDARTLQGMRDRQDQEEEERWLESQEEEGKHNSSVVQEESVEEEEEASSRMSNSASPFGRRGDPVKKKKKTTRQNGLNLRRVCSSSHVRRRSKSQKSSSGGVDCYGEEARIALTKNIDDDDEEPEVSSRLPRKQQPRRRGGLLLLLRCYWSRLLRKYKAKTKNKRLFFPFLRSRGCFFASCVFPVGKKKKRINKKENTKLQQQPQQQGGARRNGSRSCAEEEEAAPASNNTTTEKKKKKKKENSLSPPRPLHSYLGGVLQQGVADRDKKLQEMARSRRRAGERPSRRRSAAAVAISSRRKLSDDREGGPPQGFLAEKEEEEAQEQGLQHQRLCHKYRPKSFKDLVGQTLVVRSLVSAITKGRVAPVYLFSGPRGTGKTSAARVFAAALVCLATEPHRRPCGLCKECTASFALNMSFHVREVNAANELEIEHMRALLSSMSSSPFPSHSRYQVFIVEGCDFLTPEMWRTFLKFLEDPPPDIVLILITTNPERLPLTATSRCQKFLFGKVKDAEIMSRLQMLAAKENLEVDVAALSLIASRADGSLRDAEGTLDQLSLLDNKVSLAIVQELVGLIPDDMLLDLLDLALSADAVNTVRCTRELLDLGVDALSLVAQLASLITNILGGSFDIHREMRSKGGFFRRDLSSREEQHQLRQALKILLESEKQLRVSHDRPTWLTAALLQFAPDRSYVPSSVDTSMAPSPIAFETLETGIPREPYTPRLPNFRDIEVHRHQAHYRHPQLQPQMSHMAYYQNEEERLQSLTPSEGRRCVQSVIAQSEAKVHPAHSPLLKARNSSSEEVLQSSSNLLYDGHQVLAKSCDFHLLGHGELKDVWTKVLHSYRSDVLRQRMQAEGSLVSLSVANDNTYAVAHVEFQHPEHKARAERLQSGTCHAFQVALGCPVELNFRLARLQETILEDSKEHLQYDSIADSREDSPLSSSKKSELIGPISKVCAGKSLSKSSEVLGCPPDLKHGSLQNQQLEGTTGQPPVYSGNPDHQGFQSHRAGGPLGWKSTQYGNNLRSVMKPKWDEYIFKEREYMEEEVSMGRFL